MNIQFDGVKCQYLEREKIQTEVMLILYVNGGQH